MSFASPLRCCSFLLVVPLGGRAATSGSSGAASASAPRAGRRRRCSRTWSRARRARGRHVPASSSCRPHAAPRRLRAAARRSSPRPRRARRSCSRSTSRARWREGRQADAAARRRTRRSRVRRRSCRRSTASRSSRSPTTRPCRCRRPTTARRDRGGAAGEGASSRARRSATRVDAASSVAQKAVGPSKPGQPHPPAAILLLSDGAQNAGQRDAAAGGRGEARKAGDPDLDRRRSGRRGGVAPERPRRRRERRAGPQVPRRPARRCRAIAHGDRRARSSGAAPPSELEQVYKDLGSRLV